jgi:glycosyltransferase involved in cell wall biosynthesis
MSLKRVCLVTNLYAPYSIGGAEQCVQTLIGELLDHGVNVSLITTQSRKAELPPVRVEDGATVHRLCPANLYWAGDNNRRSTLLKPLWHAIDLWNPHSYVLARAVFERERPQVVHTHNLGGLSPSVWSAAKSLNIPVVHTAHDYQLLCPRAIMMKFNGEKCAGPRNPFCRAYSLAKRASADTVKVATFASKFIMDRHTAAGWFDSSKRRVIPYGIPLGSTDPAANLNRAASKILFVGGLYEHKGLNVLADAWEILFKRRPDLSLSIAGTGPMRAALEARLANQNVGFHGFVAGQAKDNLLRESDILVLSSVWDEVFGIVIPEAYKHGLAVVGSAVGGVPEVIQDGVTGRLFEPGNPSSLVEAVEWLLSGDRLHKAKKAAGERAPLYSLSNFRAAVMAEYAALADTTSISHRSVEENSARRF